MTDGPAEEEEEMESGPLKTEGDDGGGCEKRPEEGGDVAEEGETRLRMV